MELKANIKKNNKKIFVGIGILLILITFVVAAVINLKSESNGNTPPKSGIGVNIEEARIDTLISKVTATGVIEPKNIETIYVDTYIDTSLRIKDILVELGDQVKKDTEIVKYDPITKEELEQQLKEAEISLENAKLRLQSLTDANPDEILDAESSLISREKSLSDAQKELKQTELTITQLKKKIQDKETTVANNQILYDQGAIPKSELDGAKTELSELKDQLQKEQMNLESIKQNIENLKREKSIAERKLSNTYNKSSDPKQETEIKIQQNLIKSEELKIKTLKQKLERQLTSSKSPIDGTVTEILTEEGAWVNQSSPILKIADLNHLIVKVSVTEFDAPSIQVGQKAILTGDAIKGKPIEGKVTKIAPKAITQDTGEKTKEAMVEVEVEVLNNDSNLKPGYTVDVEIITAEHEDTVVIPLLAVDTDKDGTNFVYIMKDDFTVEQREIELGIYSDLYVEAKGVNPGEKIITNLSSQIQEGVKVKPMNISESGEQND
ncbi:MAG: HlyD family secretion protein [Epulopiscium sp.]|jgi:HlyD family secretion protein|nr:HlyD family secretion protein [Candidatus Epulonipiscium sp.]